MTKPNSSKRNSSRRLASGNGNGNGSDDGAGGRLSLEQAFQADSRLPQSFDGFDEWTLTSTIVDGYGAAKNKTASNTTTKPFFAPDHTGASGGGSSNSTNDQLDPPPRKPLDDDTTSKDSKPTSWANFDDSMDMSEAFTAASRVSSHLDKKPLTPSSSFKKRGQLSDGALPPPSPTTNGFFSRANAFDGEDPAPAGVLSEDQSPGSEPSFFLPGRSRSADTMDNLLREAMDTPQTPFSRKNSQHTSTTTTSSTFTKSPFSSPLAVTSPFVSPSDSSQVRPNLRSIMRKEASFNSASTRHTKDTIDGGASVNMERTRTLAIEPAVQDPPRWPDCALTSPVSAHSKEGRRVLRSTSGNAKITSGIARAPFNPLSPVATAATEGKWHLSSDTSPGSEASPSGRDASPRTRALRVKAGRGKSRRGLDNSSENPMGSPGSSSINSKTGQRRGSARNSTGSKRRNSESPRPKTDKGDGASPRRSPSSGRRRSSAKTELKRKVLRTPSDGSQPSTPQSTKVLTAEDVLEHIRNGHFQLKLEDVAAPSQKITLEIKSPSRKDESPVSPSTRTMKMDSDGSPKVNSTLDDRNNDIMFDDFQSFLPDDDDDDEEKDKGLHNDSDGDDGENRDSHSRRKARSKSMSRRGSTRSMSRSESETSLGVDVDAPTEDQSAKRRPSSSGGRRGGRSQRRPSTKSNVTDRDPAMQRRETSRSPSSLRERTRLDSRQRSRRDVSTTADDIDNKPEVPDTPVRTSRSPSSLRGRKRMDSRQRSRQEVTSKSSSEGDVGQFEEHEPTSTSRRDSSGSPSALRGHVAVDSRQRSRRAIVSKSSSDEDDISDFGEQVPGPPRSSRRESGARSPSLRLGRKRADSDGRKGGENEPRPRSRSPRPGRRKETSSQKMDPSPVKGNEDLMALALQVQPTSRSGRKSERNSGSSRRNRSRSRSRSRNPRARGSTGTKNKTFPNEEHFLSPRVRDAGKRRSGSNEDGSEFVSPQRSSRTLIKNKGASLRMSTSNVISPLGRMRTARHARSRSLVENHPLNKSMGLPKMTTRHQKSMLMWEIQSISSNMDPLAGENGQGTPNVPTSIQAGPMMQRLRAHPRDAALPSRRSSHTRVDSWRANRSPSATANTLRPLASPTNHNAKNLGAFGAKDYGQWGKSDPFARSGSPTKSARGSSRNLF